tara:strand:- start:1921 stop:4023 length:2103 start_codon:yes stop_codon:yes gene_type:complete
VTTEKYNTFVPNLSPHSLRLIRKIFIDNNNSEDLIKDLESQVTIFEKISLDEHENFFMKFNKEKISFQACCSLLADLLAGGWHVGIGLEGFLISKPDYYKSFTGKNLDETKDKMRHILKINRDKQIESIEIQRFIERMERPRKVGNEEKSILNLIDNGKELAEIFKDISQLDETKKVSLLKKIINPEVVVCYPEDPLFKEEQNNCPYTGLRLGDIWKYFRLTWSNEYKSIPGKSFPVLIRNSARPNKPIIGIAMLRSAALSDEAREDAIGWTNEATIRKKIYSKEIEIDFIVKSMTDCLKEQIDNIRSDDFEFLNSNLIKQPNDEIIKKLKQIYEDEFKRRKSDLKNEKKRPPKISGFEPEDWIKESEEAVFKKKRAIKLSRFLEIRKAFNEVNLTKDPARGYATLIHPSNKKGNELISAALREIKVKALAENIMDLGVCGAIAPYNELIGGKLVAALMGSTEVRTLFKSRYNGKKYKFPSIIASSSKGKAVFRDANLMCLTTTSLYGVASSQYNKIKFLKKDFPELETDIIWKEAKKNKESQKTKGQGVYHFSNQTSKLLSILTLKKLKYVEVNNKFGEGTSPKLRKARVGIECLIDHSRSNIPYDTFFAHSMQRKNYIFFHEKNILKKIIDQKKSFSKVSSSKVENITSAWIKRWMIKRIKRNETLEKLTTLGPDFIHNQLYFKIKDNVINIKKSNVD